MWFTRGPYCSISRRDRHQDACARGETRWLVAVGRHREAPAACHPELAGWAKILEGMGIGLQLSGADPLFGLKLPDALAEQGLASIGSEGRVPLMHTGTASIDFVALSVEQASDKLIGSGVVAAAGSRGGPRRISDRGPMMTMVRPISRRGACLVEDT